MKAPCPEDLYDYTFCLRDLLLVNIVPNRFVVSVL